MNSAAIRKLQQRLAALGLYTGPVDGQRSAALDAAARRFATGRRAEVTADPAGWTARRVTVAAYQLVLKDAQQDVGDIDGLWGSQTQFAHDNQMHIDQFGTPILFRDMVPGRGNPNGWPTDNTPSQSEMTVFYGAHGVKNGFTPPMTTVTCPWTLRLSWALTTKTTKIGCHTRVAASLGRVLAAVHAHYGTERLVELRLDVYGGCYNPRIKAGGSTWSTHSWACALDFDPDRNQLTWGRDRATLARPEYDFWWDCWEAEGWVSLGREKNFDWMHVQAAKLA